MVCAKNFHPSIGTSQRPLQEIVEMIITTLKREC
jgi:hypothetical protein